MITPEWIQGPSPPDNYWSCQTLVDSATLGDVCSERWWVYGTNGISPDSFRVRLTARDTRVLHHAYQSAGVPCSQDPLGYVNIMSIPHSIGNSVVITRLDEVRTRSRHSHVPFPSMAVFRGYDVKWPLISPDQRTVSIGGKVVILGGHPALGISGSLDHVDAEQMMGSYYPKAVAGQSLWVAQCRFEVGHFSHFFSRTGCQKGRKNSARRGHQGVPRFPRERDQEEDRSREENPPRGRAG